MKNLWQIILMFGLAAGLVGTGRPGRAQQEADRLLMPIGGGYSDIYAGFSESVVGRARDGQAHILVLAMTYSTNPNEITEGERQTNLRDAEARRYQIEEACKRAAPAGVTCTAVLAPVFVRADAEDPQNVALFTADLTAVFILGGDQTVAMQVLQDTPFEAALNEAYARGVLIAGTSAGGAVQSSSMLGGYNLNFADNTSLNFGAVDVWIPPERRGLAVGIPNAILDQHFYQRGRLGRLLNAITLPEVPHMGIGVDAYTGVHAPNGERLEQVFGLYTVTILDAQTYHAADGVQYRGPANILSLRNVLVHLLAPGASSYDLVERRHSLAAPAPTVQRTFEGLKLPEGAGTLILAGGLSEALADNPALERFAGLAGGEKARLAIIASGYPTDSSAQRAGDKYAAALGLPASVFVVANENPAAVALGDDITGILLIGRDQSRVQIEPLADVIQAWQRGTPVLADEAGAAVLGKFYSAHGPTPNDAEAEEAATQKSFLQGRTELKPGLGWLDVTIEPRLLGDNRWGRLFSLAYHQPAQLALGLNENSAIEINAQGASVLSGNAVLSLDLRQARLDLGSNEGFVIANGLLDVFGPGDMMQPAPADINAQPLRQATPVMATAIPTATTAPTATAVPTANAVPTATTAPEATATRAPTATTPPTATATPAPLPAEETPGAVAGVLAPFAAIALVIGVGVWAARRKK